MTNFVGWLTDERSRRCILIEAQAYQPGVGVITHYWSTGKFISRATDNPPHTPYLTLVSRVPEITIGLDEPLGWGDIELRNPGGALDELLGQDFGFRPVKLYLGDPAWAKSDFYRFDLCAAREGLQAAGVDKLRLTVRDALAALDVPMQTAIIPDTDKVVPLARGQNLNVEPVFVKSDINGAHYVVNDGPIHGLSVRSGGLPLDPSRLFADMPQGKFRINPPPSGRPTCSVDVAGGQVVAIVADLLNRAGVGYDAANFAHWHTECPQLAGLFVADNTDYREAIDRVLGSVGLRYHAWPDGVVRLYRVAMPIGNPVLTLIPSNMKENSLKPVKIYPPLAGIRLGYLKNDAVQDKDSLYGAVSAALAELYGQAWSVAVVESPAIVENYPSAVQPDNVTETQLTVKAEAETEAARRLTLYAAPIVEFELDYFGDPLCAPGDAVSITHPRYGFAGSRLALVTGFSWNPVARMTTLRIWAWQ